MDLRKEWERSRKSAQLPGLQKLCAKHPHLAAEMERLSLTLKQAERRPLRPRREITSVPSSTGDTVHVKLRDGTRGMPSEIARLGEWEPVYKSKRWKDLKRLADLRTGKEHADLGLVYRLKLSSDADAAACVEQVRKCGQVEYAHVPPRTAIAGAVYPPPYPPNFHDGAITQIAHLGDSLTGLSAIAAWDAFGITGAGVKLGVIDAAIYDKHINMPNLTILKNWTEMSEHGTSCASLAHATDNRNDPGNSGQTWGMVGVAPGVTPYFHEGLSSYDALVEALDALIDDVDGPGFGAGDVITLSLQSIWTPAVCDAWSPFRIYDVPGTWVFHGTKPWILVKWPCYGIEPGSPAGGDYWGWYEGEVNASFVPLDGNINTYDAMAICADAGVIVCYAAGNGYAYLGTGYSFFSHDPWGAGRLDTIIGCSGADIMPGWKNPYSGFMLGTKDNSTGVFRATSFAVAAGENPGGDEWKPDQSQWPTQHADPRYWYRMNFAGTSATTPQIAGVAALIQSHAIDNGVALTPAQVIALMQDTGRVPDWRGVVLPSFHPYWDIRMPSAAGAIGSVEEKCSLKVSVHGTGGTVTAPATEWSTHDFNATVTVTAVPGSGHRFVTWRGDTDALADPGSASTTLTMASSYRHYEIQAEFDSLCYVIATSTSGGTVTAPGEDPGPQWVTLLDKRPDDHWEERYQPSEGGWYVDFEIPEPVRIASSKYRIVCVEVNQWGDMWVSNNRLYQGATRLPEDQTYDASSIGSFMGITLYPQYAYTALTSLAWGPDNATPPEWVSVQYGQEYTVSKLVWRFQDFGPLRFIFQAWGVLSGAITCGTSIDLKAAAGSGYEFAVWMGDTDTVDDIEDAETTIQATGIHYVKARFHKEVEERPMPAVLRIQGDHPRSGYVAKELLVGGELHESGSVPFRVTDDGDVYTAALSTLANTLRITSTGLTVPAYTDKCNWSTLTAPTGLDNESISSSGFTATWSAVDNADDYLIELHGNSGYTDLLDSKTPVGTSQAFTGLSNTTQYWWRVQARGAGYLDSAWATSTVVCMDTLSAPAELANTAIGVTGFTANWASVVDADDYLVEVHSNSGYTALVDSKTPTGTSQAFSGLNPCTQYWWRVRARATGYYDSAWAGHTATTVTWPDGDGYVYNEGDFEDEWITGYANNDGSQSKESTRLYLLGGSAQGSGRRTWQSIAKINLTSYSSLKIIWENTGASSNYNYSWLWVTPTKDAEVTTYEERTSKQQDFISTTTTLSISSVNKECYINIMALAADANTMSEIRIAKIWLE